HTRFSRDWSSDVCSSDLRNAMESGLGGAALKSGETMQGSFKHMGAALSRLGQNLLKGVFPQLAGGFTGITQALDNLGPAAEKVGAFLGDVLAKAASFITEKVVPAARAGIEAIQLFIGSFTGEGADIGEFLPPDLWDPIINAGAK